MEEDTLITEDKSSIPTRTPGRHFPIVQGSKEWKERRRRYVCTGSEFAAAAGFSPYKSRAALWRDKTGRTRSPEAQDDFRDACLAYGTENEPHARDLLSAVLSSEIDPCGFFEYHDDPRFGTSPDGLVRANGCPCEIKCPVSGSSTAGPSDTQLCQVYAHMACTGKDLCYFMNYGGTELSMMTVVHWDQEKWEFLYWCLCEFAGYIERDEEPPKLHRRRVF